MGIAFVYGLIHAAGPEHGKALVALYFTTNHSDYKVVGKSGGFRIIIYQQIEDKTILISIYSKPQKGI